MLRNVRIDAARAKPHHAVAAMRQRDVVRHKYQRHAALGMFGEQEIDDLLAGGLIKVAGRLVSPQNGWIGRERAGERNALLLAAGKLRGIMMQPIAKAHGSKLLRGALGGIGISS